MCNVNATNNVILVKLTLFKPLMFYYVFLAMVVREKKTESLIIILIDTQRLVLFF